jgi:hypothetical protein
MEKILLNNKSIEFYNFCSNFTYVNGCDELVNNCLSVFYNLMLVLGKKRTSFLIQPIDYKNRQDYDLIMENITKIDNLSTLSHQQGTLIFIKSNTNFINMVLKTNSDNEPNNKSNNEPNRKLGYILSYPCYNHEWTNTFARLCLIEKNVNNRIVLFANWCRNLSTFESGTKEMKEYLEKNFECKCFIESNIETNTE